MTIEITLNSIVDCSHLTIQPEGDEFSIGDPGMGEFLRVPEVAVDVVRQLDGKRSLQSVKEEIDHKYEEDVDVVDFVATLEDCQLVYSIDNQVLYAELRKQANPALHKLGLVFFNKFAVSFYAVCLVLLVGMLAANVELIPTYRDMFVFESIGLSGLVLLLVGWILTIIHEFGHLLAASKEKIPAKIRLNLRMIWLVAETDMTGLWSKPKSARYLPFLAGMAWDVVLILACMVIQVLSPNELVVALSRMVAFICMYSFVWQFIIFLRTDIYYVVANWRNSSAMHEHGLLFLRKTFMRKDERAWSGLPDFEKVNAKWFGFLYIIGGVIGLGLFVYIQVPAFFYMINHVFTSLTAYTISDYLYWDGLLVLAVLVIQLITWLVGFRNSRKEATARRNFSGVDEVEGAVS